MPGVEVNVKTIATRSDLDVFTLSENLYVVLGVAGSASAGEIKAAYRRLALLYHPDRHQDKDRLRAAEVFKRINTAYKILSDPEERRHYDLLLRQGAGARLRDQAVTQKVDPLALILEDILRYEHIFAEEDLRRMEKGLRALVKTNLISDLKERVVGAVEISSVPLGYEHEGGFVKGYLVITNLRLLFPFWTQWQETRGRVQTTYTRHYLRGTLLPEVHRVTITTVGRIARKTLIELKCRSEVIVFAPAEKNLGKLLLLCSLWGIPVMTREIPDRANDIRSATLSLPKAIGKVLAGANGLLLLCGFCSSLGPNSSGSDSNFEYLFMFNAFCLPPAVVFGAIAAGIGIIRALKAYGRVRIEDLLDGEGGPGER
jgi:DnaJ-domain-containing protein 1